MLAGLLKFARDLRDHQRHRVPKLMVRFNGSRYKTDDWSLGGFKIDNCNKTLEPLEQISGEISMPIDGSKGLFTAEVIWTDDDGAAGLRFLAISPQILAVMAEVSGTNFP